jgi:hypothetical protein
MKKVIRLTESDLTRIIKRVISEAKGDTKCDKFFKEILKWWKKIYKIVLNIWDICIIT